MANKFTLLISVQIVEIVKSTKVAVLTSSTFLCKQKSLFQTVGPTALPRTAPPPAGGAAPQLPQGVQEFPGPGPARLGICRGGARQGSTGRQVAWGGASLYIRMKKKDIHAAPLGLLFKWCSDSTCKSSTLWTRSSMVHRLALLKFRPLKMTGSMSKGWISRKTCT